TPVKITASARQISFRCSTISISSPGYAGSADSALGCRSPPISVADSARNRHPDPNPESSQPPARGASLGAEERGARRRQTYDSTSRTDREPLVAPCHLFLQT